MTNPYRNIRIQTPSLLETSMGKKHGRRAFLAAPSNLKALDSYIQKMLLAVIGTPTGNCNQVWLSKPTYFWAEEDLVGEAIQPCKHHRFIDQEYYVLGPKGLIRRESW